MRISWSLPLPGPFRVGGTVWRSGRRGYHGTLAGWKCPHNHSRMDLAVACANRHARSPEYQAQQPAPSSVYDPRFYPRRPRTGEAAS